MLREQCQRLGRRRLVLAESQLRVEPVLHDGQAELFQPLRVATSELVVQNVRIGGPPPKPQRTIRERRREPRVVRLQGGARLPRQTLETDRVDRPAVETKCVTRPFREDDAPIERLPQLRDVELEQLACRRRRRLAPNGVRESIDRTHAAVRERERREQPAVLEPGQLDDHAVSARLERPEHPYLQPHGRILSSWGALYQTYTDEVHRAGT